MLDHPVVDIALGLFWLYLLLSLTASAVREWIAGVIGLRARNLRAGIRSLIGDEYARRLYDHPLVRNLGKKKPLLRSVFSKSKKDRYTRPSYIAPETLSSVLLAVLAKDTGGKSLVTYGAGEVRGVVEEIRDDHPLKPVLQVLVDDSEGAATQLRDRLAGWFDEGMTRVSGWYKLPWAPARPMWSLSLSVMRSNRTLPGRATSSNWPADAGLPETEPPSAACFRSP